MKKIFFFGLILISVFLRADCWFLSSAESSAITSSAYYPYDFSSIYLDGYTSFQCDDGDDYSVSAVFDGLENNGETLDSSFSYSQATVSSEEKRVLFHIDVPGGQNISSGSFTGRIAVTIEY